MVEEVSPLIADVLMRPTNPHLPGFQEVEDLALLLLKLIEGEQHIIPAPLRQELAKAAGKLQEHDKSARNFVKKYKSTWGYTLFGRCLGGVSQESSAAQKTKFGWMRFAQAASITDESRLLYILIKMLKNRPLVSGISSPTKAASQTKARYKRIVDRVRDDPLLSGVDIPLPNINAKSITAFISKEEKQANYLATPGFKKWRTLRSSFLSSSKGSSTSSRPPSGRSLPKLQGNCRSTIRAPATLSRNTSLPGVTLCSADAWVVYPRRAALPRRQSGLWTGSGMTHSFLVWTSLFLTSTQSPSPLSSPRRRNGLITWRQLNRR